MMELSTKGRYATRIMVYLAKHAGEQPVPKKAIAEAENISPDYAEQLLIKLKTGGLVASHRGVQGGFSLTRAPNEVTVRNVLEVVEGPIMVAPCDETQCSGSAACVTRPLWREVEGRIREVLDGTTIGLLVQRLKERDRTGADSFCI